MSIVGICIIGDDPGIAEAIGHGSGSIDFMITSMYQSYDNYRAQSAQAPEPALIIYAAGAGNDDLAALTDSFPASRVIVLTESLQMDVLVLCMRLDISGYMSSVQSDALIDAMERTLSTGTIFSHWGVPSRSQELIVSEFQPAAA